MRSDGRGEWRGRNGWFCSGRFNGRRQRSRRRRWRGGHGRLGNFKGGRNLYRNRGLDWLGLDRWRSRRGGLLDGRGRSRGGEADFEFVDAGF